MDQDKKLYEILKEATKSQLHLHLDGCLSLEFIRRSYKRMTSRNPNFRIHADVSKWECLEDLVEFAKKIQVPINEKMSANKPLQSLYYFCNAFLQTPEDIFDAVVDVTSRLYFDHSVTYLELRFAPHFHTHMGYSLSEIISSAVSGFEHAQQICDGNIEGGIIICAIRSNLPQCFELIRECEKNKKVLGVDIAGDERSFHLDMFEDFLRECKEKSINITTHAGEFFELHENISSAIRYGVQRIGHGLAVKNLSESDIELLKERNISVEVILTENCGNPMKNVTFENHPIKYMINHGVKVAALNCDNMLDSGSQYLSRPDPTMECVRALLLCKLTVLQVHEILRTGYEVAFNKNNVDQKEEFKRVWQKSIFPKLNNFFG